MNLAQSRVVLRQRTIAEILDLASHLCSSQALGLYARLALVVLLPGYVFCLVLRYALDWSWISVWVAAWLMASLLQGVFCVAAGRWIFSETLSVGDVLRMFGKQLVRYLGAWLAKLAFLGCSTVLLPYAATRLLFVHEASLLERASWLQASRRSSRSVRGAGDRVFVMWLALGTVQLTCIALAEVLCDGLVEGVLQLSGLVPPLWQELGSPYALLGLMLSVPIVATARFLMYIDLRTRRDGWDIQVRFMAIASTEQPSLGGAS